MNAVLFMDVVPITAFVVSAVTCRASNVVCSPYLVFEAPFLKRLAPSGVDEFR
jgi:hypothetical protein